MKNDKDNSKKKRLTKAGDLDKRIGNKFALGLTTNGQPPMYDEPEKLQEIIVDYFESLKDEETNTFKERPTITGMALYLGFCSRQSMYEYKEKKDFSYIIKRATMVIESTYERMLTEKNATGCIFALKNMGWKDERDIKSESIIKATITGMQVK